MMLAVMAGFCSKVKEAHFSQENGKAKAKLASMQAFSQGANRIVDPAAGFGLISQLATNIVLIRHVKN
jgi:hypothetical protein